MKVYHGSSFRKLSILTSEFSDDENFEGKACYFSDSFDVAKEYADKGGSVYEVFIDDELLDLTTKDNIDNLLSKILKKIDIDINDFEFLGGGAYHVLNHHGKNGIWCLGKDISQLLKFEPKFKNRTDLKELEILVENEIQSTINQYSGWIINDSGNRYCKMIIHKGPVPVKKEYFID